MLDKLFKLTKHTYTKIMAYSLLENIRYSQVGTDAPK